LNKGLASLLFLQGRDAPFFTLTHIILSNTHCVLGFLKGYNFTMNMRSKIVFIGGDFRQRAAAESLAREGRSVFYFGGDGKAVEGVTQSESLKDALLGADIAVLPLPCTLDGVGVNAPFFSGGQIRIFDVLDALSKDTLLVGGRMPEEVLKYSEKKGIKTIDYFLSEAFQIKNAYTTAEAALSIAMNNMKKNIRGARFAITGYGRIARALTELLLKLGGEVCVLARKESDLAWAELSGATAKRITEESIMELRSGYDVIFNTVPSWLFFESFLLNMDKKTKLIELASSPGGVDVSSAKRLGSQVLWASSLPGKYAPESAGELIADCVRNIASEVGL
jgi:dipicolinate synthase subunit A